MQTERFTESLAKCGDGERVTELGILAQEEKDTIVNLGRRANARVWGAKSEKGGGGGS